jgi:hypothetical protein
MRRQRHSNLALTLSFVAGGMALVTGWLGGERVDRLGARSVRGMFERQRNVLTPVTDVCCDWKGPSLLIVNMRGECGRLGGHSPCLAARTARVDRRRVRSQTEGSQIRPSSRGRSHRALLAAGALAIAALGRCARLICHAG